MHYYRRHLGDYARKAGHLTMLEHGAYNLILDAYYDREVAPTRAEAIRYARARSAEEVAAVDAVLAEFFSERDGRYYQARVEAEFEEAATQAEKNRENGKLGGRPRKTTPSTPKKPKKTQPVFSGNPNESQKNPNPLIHQSTNPEEAKALVPSGTDRFDDFWRGYPVKKARKAAAEAWAKKAQKLNAIADQLIAHVETMKAQDDDWRGGYAPHGATYINGERWHDEPKRRNTGPPQQHAQPSKTLSAIHQLEAMKHGLAGNRNPDGLPETALLGLGADPGY